MKIVAHFNLFLKTIVIACKLVYLTEKGTEHLLLQDAHNYPRVPYGDYTREQVVDAVNRSLFILRRFGFRYACYGRSVLLYHMLRWAGLKAQINFSADVKDREVRGHCWVSDDGAYEGDRTIIATYS